MTTNYMTENRQLIKQLEKRQHLQSKLDKAVEALEDCIEYSEGCGMECEGSHLLLNKAEQFLKDCKE